MSTYKVNPTPRCISLYTSRTTRYISTLNANHTTAELDSHADTTAVGKGAYITEDTGHTVTVHPFATGLNTIKEVPIVTAAIAYDCPTTHIPLHFILSSSVIH